MFNGSHKERVRFNINKPKKRIEGLCWIAFSSGRNVLFDCVVDTGAHYVLVPQERWKNHVSADDALKLKKGETRGIGGSLEVLETKLPITIVSRDSAFELGPCTVLLALDEDAAEKDKKHQPLRQVLLGIGGGTLDKGGLCINWKEGHASFVEVDDAIKPQ